MSDQRPVVGRKDFIKDLMTKGFSFAQSVTAYESVMSTIANGVVLGQSVYFGEVGKISPVVCPPRTVNMGCMKAKGGTVVRLKRQYFLDTRLKYKFRLFDKFLERHQLDWHSS